MRERRPHCNFQHGTDILPKELLELDVHEICDDFQSRIVRCNHIVAYCSHGSVGGAQSVSR